MITERLPVGLVVARRKLSGPWASHRWLPVAVLAAPAGAAAWTSLPGEPGDETFYAGAFEIALHAGDTAQYRDNLESGRPSVWAALRPGAGERVEVAGLSVDPYEGESMALVEGDAVEALAMPAELVRRVAAFVDAHHVERDFFKRERKRADPEALARRAPIAPDDDE